MFNIITWRFLSFVSLLYLSDVEGGLDLLFYGEEREFLKSPARPETRERRLVLQKHVLLLGEMLHTSFTNSFLCVIPRWGMYF